MSTQSNAMKPTMRRPVPLCIRADLKTQLVMFRGRSYWAVKDPVALKYHRLREEQYFLLSQLDGRRTLEELQQLCRHRFPHTHWGLTELQALISDLHEKRLVTSQRSGQAEGIGKQRQKSTQQKLMSGLMSFLFIRFPGVYPEPFLRTVYPWIRWVFHPVAVCIVLSSVVAAMSLLAVNFDIAIRQMPEFQQFFAWPNLMYLSLTMAAVKVFHELGHGFTCHHFGAESHSIGLMLLVFSPTLYCDVTDSWMLPDKWQRILIAAAGIYVEIFFSAIALFTWWYSDTGLLHHLALNVFFVTTVSTVIFNLNPLMRFDGYYILSDLLEIPNLQQRSSRALQSAIGWHCFGIEPQPDPFEPERSHFWIVLFVIASSVYRAFVMVGIGLFLYTVLKPYRLQTLGIMLSTFSIGMMAGQFLYQLTKMVRTPRQKPLSRRRILVTGIIITLLGAGIARLPVPIYIQAAVLIQPHNVQHVYTKTAGRMHVINIQSGGSVAEGGVIATLVNPELDDQLRELELQIEIQKKRQRTAAAQENPAQKQLATNTLASHRDQLQEVQQQRERLILRSPAAGKIVSAEYQTEPQHTDDNHSLNQWHGDPLTPHNQGAFIQPNTHICSIAPDEQLEAVLYIDQADRNELQSGHAIRIKFDHLPEEIYEGKIADLSTQAVAYVPAVLSNKTGGPLPTITEEGSRERLTSVAWKARVVLDHDTDLFVSGLRGRARVVIANKSLGSWLYRWIRNTVHFRL